MSEPIKINGARALELLEQAVKERGEDYIYPKLGGSCFYWHPRERGEEGPGCIVGLALFKAGVPGSTLQYCEGSIFGVAKSFRWKHVHLSNLAVGIFIVAQRHQDQGLTWGYAASEARRFYETNKETDEEMFEHDLAYYEWIDQALEATAISAE